MTPEVRAAAEEIIYCIDSVSYPREEIDLAKCKLVARAVLASVPEDGWRGIESAPKDETPIVALWLSETFPKVSVNNVAATYWADGGWVNREALDSGEDDYHYSPPTHWTALPVVPPPVPAAKEPTK